MPQILEEMSLYSTRLRAKRQVIISAASAALPGCVYLFTAGVKLEEWTRHSKYLLLPEMLFWILISNHDLIPKTGYWK